DEVVLRAEMLRRVAESGLDEATLYVLVNVIETYFPLTGAALERFGRPVSRKESRTVEEVEMTWADRIHEKGVIEGKRQALLKFLNGKFGPLSTERTTRVETLSSDIELDRYLDRAVTATTLEDVGL
ncbi:MAG: hypothetical protein ACRD21_12715, partial [Vicinamibacteria bacterium]